MDVLTDTKSLIDMLTPSDPQHKKCFAHRTCRYQIEYTDIQWSIQWMGVLDTWGGINSPLGGVQHMGATLHPHITCRYPLEHKDAQGSIGDIWGCLNIWGCQGHTNIWGAYRHPLGAYIQMPASTKSPLPIRHACL